MARPAPVLAGGGLPLYVVASVILSVGLAPVGVVATGLAVSAAPERQAGRASALLETCSNLGGALGNAILGSIAGVAFRAEMSGAPSGVLLDGARTAFGHAFALTQVLGAGGLVGATRSSSPGTPGPSPGRSSR